MNKRSIIPAMCVFFCLMMFGQAVATDYVMFNYQGRVKVLGDYHNGLGEFKFAIVNNAGNVTLWSHDGTSVDGGETTSSLTINVVSGIFNVLVGDPSAGFDPINRTVFNHPEQIKLRVWFSDGVNGFQQLLPDKKLINVDLLGQTSGTVDFTIYVNGATGDDANNGLTPGKAKKTIQAAVDVLPERLFCNVTIKVADGIYREQVNVLGISVIDGKKLYITGDEVWTPTSVGDPTVRVTGTDDDITPVRSRSTGFSVVNCYGVEIKGFQINHTTKGGILTTDSNVTFRNCKVTDNQFGFYFAANTRGNLYDSTASNNTMYGVFIVQSFINLFGKVIARNNAYGVGMQNQATGSFRCAAAEFQNNTHTGVTAFHGSAAVFNSDHSGTVSGNGTYAFWIAYNSYMEGVNENTHSGTIHLEWNGSSHNP